MARQFVCVRLQSMNEVNLNAFQFDFDVTWMAFFQNSVGQNYARYGGRDDVGSESYLTKKSLLQTMERVLKLHKTNAVRPISKYEPKSNEVSTPEDIPTMKPMMSKRTESCIHCHDVKNATLHRAAELGKLSKDMVFTYPSPKRLGIVLDADDQTLIKSIVAKSPAENVGLKKGDVVESADGSRVLTFGDFTRVLEVAPDTGRLPLAFRREGETKQVALQLSPGWKRSPNPSWRPSTHVVGPSPGFWGKPLPVGQLKQHKLTSKDLAVKIVVAWGAWARKAGLKKGDIVVEIDGVTSALSMKEVSAHVQMNREFGDEIEVEVIRRGKRQRFKIKLPASAPRV
jgi:hypothetical protein